jgi:ribulose-5-phosphate 4-epimerase/fuculose-1-phosphate aldolase
VADFGWSDSVVTHISARLPETDEFLLNPYGMLFEEITASSLVKVNREGEILSATPYSVNRAGFVIHSAVHDARPDAGCVLHLHTLDGVAVSATERGLLELDQFSILVCADLAYHDYEGPALRLDERERLAKDLGPHHFMILRNHGLLSVGSSIADAFGRMYLLENACAMQVRCLGMGLDVNHPSSESKAGSLEMLGRVSTFHDEVLWPAMLRRLDRVNPGYDS